jgi:hypothetical protein
MREVTFAPADLRLLAGAVKPDRVSSLLDDGERLRTGLAGAAVVCVNSTATRGGVAEMLHDLLPYVWGVGIDVR